MAIEQGIWRIDQGQVALPQRLATARLDDENQLEELIVRIFAHYEHRFSPIVNT